MYQFEVARDRETAWAPAPSIWNSGAEVSDERALFSRLLVQQTGEGIICSLARQGKLLAWVLKQKEFGFTIVKRPHLGHS